LFLRGSALAALGRWDEAGPALAAAAAALPDSPVFQARIAQVEQGLS